MDGQLWSSFYMQILTVNFGKKMTSTFINKNATTAKYCAVNLIVSYDRTFFAEFDFYAKNPQRWVATFTKSFDKMMENK